MQDFSYQLIIQIKPNVYMNIILINNIELISLFHEKIDTPLKRQNNI